MYQVKVRPKPREKRKRNFVDEDFEMTYIIICNTFFSVLEGEVRRAGVMVWRGGMMALTMRLVMVMVTVTRAESLEPVEPTTSAADPHTVSHFLKSYFLFSISYDSMTFVTYHQGTTKYFSTSDYLFRTKKGLMFYELDF